MNIKLFYTIRACDSLLPSELTEKIWGHVRDSAADVIGRMYTFKISRNMDIFLRLINIGNQNNNFDYTFVNKYIKLNMNKITYTYIQEPGTWINYLENIVNIYSNERYFHVNNVCFIINSIRNSNEIYNNTRITWWEYM